MPTPTSTYRLQLHQDFTFEQVQKLTEYFKSLGIDTIYASPVFKARKGSQHGYDLTDPNQINPEIGSEDSFKRLIDDLKTQGIGWLQDFVPNHMAFSLENPWIYDVLAKGIHSPYCHFFDIDWNHPHPDLQKRLMTPFLGEPLNEALEAGKIKLQWRNNQFVFNYYENTYPVNIPSYPYIFSKTDNIPEALKSWIDQISHEIQPDTKREKWLQQLESILSQNTEIQQFLENCVNNINEDIPSLLHLHEQQHFALTYWRDTEKHINYRRFFTVNELICTRIEYPEVYAHYHQKIHELITENGMLGVRIDHIDGLYNPYQYLARLREHISNDPYLIVEKILEPYETLPENWPVQGTTGYDFMAWVNQLLAWPDGEKNLHAIYQNLVPKAPRDYHQLLLNKKHFILFQRMAGELDNLLRYFRTLQLDKHNKFNDEEWKNTIGALLVHFPVYKIYLHPFPPGDTESPLLFHAFSEARQYHPELKKPLKFLEQIYLSKKGKNIEENSIKFLRYFLQFTGPLMAKGGEDTTFYLYNRSLAQNEVGGNPGSWGVTPEHFHLYMEERQNKWPASMNATATHDTKRGEDARARLQVISSISEEWYEKAKNWFHLNHPLKHNNCPSPNDEYLIYQTLVAMVPFHGKVEEQWIQRLKDYLIKALREGKANTNWSEPNQKYEKEVLNFVDKLLAPQHSFWQEFRKIHQKISGLGIFHSLAQIILKHTSPGLPDLYQGNELWDFSLVDPDNRRPVDYDLRRKYLEEIQNILQKGNQQKLKELWQHPEDGRIKMWFTYQLLQLRKSQQKLFETGEYIPLQVQGKHAEKVFAFARYYQNQWVLSVIPLHPGTWNNKPSRVNWKDTEVILPDHYPEKWVNILDLEEHPGTQTLKVNQIFKNFPFAVLQGQLTPTGRGAGILMHLTSLPSTYGIGDMGPSSYQFINMLRDSNQQYWQVLPLTPVNREGGYSPYSSESAFAGNILLISPDKLLEQGLINSGDLRTKKGKKVQYAFAARYKRKLLGKAFKNFKENPDPLLKDQFNDFIEQHQHWLEDYALYRALKVHFNEKPWHQWPEKIKFRDPAELEQYQLKLAGNIEEEQFSQFIFWKQWQELKNQCAQKSVTLIGDLPIYVNYDSADVWSHPHYFKLDQNLLPEKVAGVPPDLFSETGQLWGMPVFNWDTLAKNNFDWWISRLRHNLEQFDLLRLDHFRAFSAFWEVPANEATAINGAWVTGPGYDFFNVVKKQWGTLPFIAEDLGEIDDAVYELRDDFELPGMQVLQFGFGEPLGSSIHLPHHYRFNSVTYTGTHDNNTLKGWFKKEIDSRTKFNLSEYLGKKITEKNIQRELIREAYKSVAKIVIIPMQDILELDERSKMNRPGTVKGNWRWKMDPRQFSGKNLEFLKRWVTIYGRNY